MLLLSTMEINKITLNGVEYAITDKEAQQVAAFLSKRVDYLETATADFNKEVIEIRKENQQLKDELNQRLGWAVFGEDGTVEYE